MEAKSEAAHISEPTFAGHLVELTFVKTIHQDIQIPNILLYLQAHFIHTKLFQQVKKSRNQVSHESEAKTKDTRYRNRPDSCITMICPRSPA